MCEKPREPYKRNRISDADEMSLPEGKTCGNCVHLHRCKWLCGHIPEDEVCDFYPIRFQEAPGEPIGGRPE
jgi:hypothetical protein